MFGVLTRHQNVIEFFQLSHENTFRGQAKHACLFLWELTMAKENSVQISKTGHHVIRNQSISLSPEEFRERSKAYVGTLWKVFCKWAGESESDKGPASWGKMSRGNQDSLLKEFFDLYLTG